MHREIWNLAGTTEYVEEAADRNPNTADYQYILGGAYGQRAQGAGEFKQAFPAPRRKNN